MLMSVAQVLPPGLKRCLHRLRLWLRRRQRDWADLRARVHEAPVLILGHQKCGTSIVAALLGEISGATVAIDLMREVDHPTFQRVADQSLSLDDFIRLNRLEFSREVVKEANLTPMYAALRQRFPKARFGFVQRDPRDNIRSILQRLNLPGRPAEASPAALAAISPAWQLVLDGGWLGLNGANYLEMLAARWQYFAAIAAAAPLTINCLRYEDFKADKVASIRNFAAQLGLAHDREIGHRIDVQYQPKGDHRESWEEYFGADGLQTIERICASGMQYFNYAQSSPSAS